MDNLSDGPSLRSGATMPLVGFGTWQTRGEETYGSVRAALQAGYRHIDTATMYRNEEQVGRALAESDVDRADVFVTTKLPAEQAGQARHTLERSLRDLGLDHVDLWLIHWPPDGTADPATWQEFLRARNDGLATDVGVSNYSLAQLDELWTVTGETPSVNQIRWSIELYDAAIEAGHRERDVLLEGYSPFRRGNLSDPVLQSIAAEHGVGPAQVVVRWHVQHGFVVIPKSARPERIRSNADILGFSLTDDQMARLDALSTG